MKKNLSIILVCVILIVTALSGCNADRVTQTQQTDEPQVTKEASPTPTKDSSTQPTSPTPSPTAALTPSPPPSELEETVYATLMVDLDNDGSEEELVISVNKERNILRVKVDEEMLEIETFDTDRVNSFITETKDGDKYLLLSYNHVCDFTEFIAFQNNIPYIIDSICGNVDKVEGEIVTLICVTDVIGTWYFYADFIIQNDSVEELTGDKEFVITEKYEPLITSRELKVDIVDGEIFKERILETGTVMYPMATDKKTYILFKLENGEEGRFFFTSVDYEFYINGISEYEYFEEVNYWDYTGELK